MGGNLTINDDISINRNYNDENNDNNDCNDNIIFNIYEHISSTMICSDNIGGNCSFSITENKTVISFGFSNHNKHGHTKTQIDTFQYIKGLKNIKSLACGTYHTICIDYNGSVYSFGCNDCGQLGIGKDVDELKMINIPQKLNIPSIYQVSCGENFTMCLSDNGILYTFGDNAYGQLGLGNISCSISPTCIPEFYDIEFVVCGEHHTICKTYNHKYYSWGCNRSGQLGQGNYEHCKYPTECLNWPDNIISIKSGNNHSLLLTSEGNVYSFGCNAYGQLGLSTSLNIPTLIPEFNKIRRIECGNNHSICIDLNNYLWLFGNNLLGQLGLGDNVKRYKPTIHSTLEDIIDISSGGDHTFVKTSDNKIYAFGDNSHFQLGIEPEIRNYILPIQIGITSKEYYKDPKQVFIDNEEIWTCSIKKSRAKSARK